MPGIINKQPVFTTAPILTTNIINPTIVSNVIDPSSYLGTGDLIYTSTDPYGTLIERITVSSTGDTNNVQVTAKLIYLYIHNIDRENWSLYKTAAMPATTVSDTTPNVEIEWVFTGGLLLPNNYRLYIGVSVNSSTYDRNGDYLSITVEGSTYTAL